MINVGRCGRCGAFLIGEQSKSHTCEAEIKEVVDIYFDWMTDGVTNENGDLERTALANDGTLYGLIICKHQPSHAAESRWLNGRDNTRKPPPDKLAVYPIGGSLTGFSRSCRLVG